MSTSTSKHARSTRPRTPKSKAKSRRRFIDYPRQGKTGWRRWMPSWRQVTITALLGLIGLATAFIVAYQTISIPDPNELLRAQTTTIQYADESTIARLYEQNRTSIPLSDVPVDTQHAVLSAENREFYTDPGISVTGVVRSIWVNLTSDASVGGSTITQQYVKNMYLTQERSWERKVKEAFISLKIDREMSKDEILEDYLNTIYFGRGAYGIQAAAQAYYGKDAKDLSVSEGALLAARIQNPSSFDDPDRQDALHARWEYVLDGMVEQGWLSGADRTAQTYPAIRDNSQDVRFPGQTGYLVSAAKAELAELGFTDDQIERGGLRVTTTFDPTAQASAESAVESQLPPQAEWPENFHVGLAAVRPGTGEVVAIYGGKGYQAEAYFNDAIQGGAQTGSTFKPFALAAWLEDGHTLRDRFNGANDRVFPEYDPEQGVPNFGGESFGFIDLVTATAHSVNTAYVDLTIQLGAQKVLDSAVAAGIPEDTQDLNANPSVVLGVANVHPVDLANAYATIADGGTRTPWHVVATVTGPDGEVLYSAEPEQERAYDADVTADVSYAMQAVVEEGSGFRAQELGRPSAGKTGTTNSNRSAWYAGFVPQLSAVVGLWEEGADASLSGFGGLSTVTGGSYPAAVWTAFMQGALEGTPVQNLPEPAWVNTDEPATTPPVAPPTSVPPTTSTPTAEPTDPTEEPTSEPTPTETPTIQPPTTEPTEPPTTEPPTSNPPTKPPTIPGVPGDTGGIALGGLVAFAGLGGAGGLWVTARSLHPGIGSLRNRGSGAGNRRARRVGRSERGSAGARRGRYAR